MRLRLPICSRDGNGRNRTGSDDVALGKPCDAGSSNVPQSLLFTIVKNKCLNNITHNQIKQRVHEKLYAKFENQFEDPDFYIEGELIALATKAIRSSLKNTGKHSK